MAAWLKKRKDTKEGRNVTKPEKMWTERRWAELEELRTLLITVAQLNSCLPFLDRCAEAIELAKKLLDNRTLTSPDFFSWLKGMAVAEAKASREVD